MTPKQKVLLILIGLIGGYLFTWPFALAMIAFFSLVAEVENATEPPAEQ